MGQREILAEPVGFRRSDPRQISSRTMEVGREHQEEGPERRRDCGSCEEPAIFTSGYVKEMQDMSTRRKNVAQYDFPQDANKKDGAWDTIAASAFKNMAR